MTERRRKYGQYGALPKRYYHLCTDGWQEGRLFHSPEQYAAGMDSMALACARFPVRIYAFELMPNHFHIVLSATGRACVQVFSFLCRRISARLVSDGYAPLPKNYDFQLIPIDSKESLKTHILYVHRNRYEKNACTPGGSEWGTDYLFYNPVAAYLSGVRIDSFSLREQKRKFGSKTVVPGHWLWHPKLGILPGSYVDTKKTLELFPSVKQYVTRIVKDYEMFVHLSRELAEPVEWSPAETAGIVQELRAEMFPGKTHLNSEDQCRLASHLGGHFDMSPEVISEALGIPVPRVRQILRSKEFGSRRKP